MQPTLSAPIVVDLDGTLTPTDTLIESIVRLIKQSPLCVFLLPLWLLKGRYGFKEAIAQRTNLVAGQLPYRQSLIDYLQMEKSKGRSIVLATAAHHSIANAVARHLDLFDRVLASADGCNLKGARKLESIQKHVGDRFVYAGDSKADLPVWRASEAAILVGASEATERTVRNLVPVERKIDRAGIGIELWLKAIRAHQWLKNTLLFVPLFTAFSFANLDKWSSAALAFLAFSLAASATYLVNDLWDLDNDRAHPRKKLRPLASGQLPIMSGLVGAAVGLTIAIVVAIKVSGPFLMMLLLYLLLTSAYSWMLKEYVLIDVVMLSVLYTLRILAGSIAVEIPTSDWLLAFSVFIFLSLALVKRCAELMTLGENGVSSTRGRDYRVTDLVILWPLGVGAALSAVVVFGLFINTPETNVRYETPQLLWLLAIALVYWLARLWIKTSRGEMHDDPVVYAVKDRGSRVTVGMMLNIMLIAYFFKLI